MRIFFATGEASGDMLAATLADAMREFVPEATFGGIGGERMLAAGFTLTTRTAGWASLGPIEALRRIPPLLANVLRHVAWLRASPWDLIVLVDFGAYNLNFAKLLRASGYTGPILYYFPPGAWLDRPKQAAAVARTTFPLTAFAHQRDFYRSLGLPIASFGHPLVSLVVPRPPRPPAPPGGGLVALLPGSRRGEIERLLPPLLAACALVRASRPAVRFVVGAADGEAHRQIEREVARGDIAVTIVRGARAAFDAADAAWIASGTAVLEATLREVPTVALYKVAPAQEELARRVWLRAHPFITLPNILLDREVVPECLQEFATPERLASALEAILTDARSAIEGMREVRAALGNPDALRRCAAFAVALASGA
jgi:lipid-A-disaccharide synthase